MKKRPIIALSSDFGTDDGSLGSMKGVILARAGDAEIVEIAHAIRPQDIRSGACILREFPSLFSPMNHLHRCGRSRCRKIPSSVLHVTLDDSITLSIGR